MPVCTYLLRIRLFSTEYLYLCFQETDAIGSDLKSVELFCLLCRHVVKLREPLKLSLTVEYSA